MVQASVTNSNCFCKGVLGTFGAAPAQQPACWLAELSEESGRLGLCLGCVCECNKIPCVTGQLQVLGQRLTKPRNEE